MFTVRFCPKCGKIRINDVKCTWCKDNFFQRTKTIEANVSYEVYKEGVCDIKTLDKTYPNCGYQEQRYRWLFDNYLKDDPNYNNDLYASQLEDVKKTDEYITHKIIMQKLAPTSKCPTCGSEKIEKISTTSRVVSTVTLGLASNKIGKTFKCKDCGYTW